VSTNKWCRFTLIDAYLPTLLTAESFELICLYFVFSHLPEEMHWALLREFHRLLMPGGMHHHLARDGAAPHAHG